jgi:leucyl/phenylalanyl-tRNA--protein transferase
MSSQGGFRTSDVFPDPREADDSGLLCYGGELTVDLMLAAYAKGIFPWPVDPETPVLWFSPPERGVLDFDELHVSRSLRKLLNQQKWTYTRNKDFFSVIRGCQKTPRPGQSSTWITDELLLSYLQLHQQGFAHSIEVWNGANELVGGIYGVRSEKYFSAESMFFRESNASKAAFVYLVDWLKSEGFSWMDVQMVTATSQKLGCKLITRDKFLERIGA